MYIRCGKALNPKGELGYKYKTFIGVDEAGRGCLAGPVVAAAVYVKKDQVGELINIKDSKKLSAKKRIELYDEIVSKYKYSIGIVDNKTIDRINILQASLLAMKKAIVKINTSSEIILVDGPYKIPDILNLQKPEIKGDSRFYSVGAASIVAKVYRDRIMEKYSKKYPNFSFQQHKGYGTLAHKNEIKSYGVLDIHRHSFKLS